MSALEKSLDIRPADLRSAEAAVLIAALNAELNVLYPEAGANHFRLDSDDVTEGRGAFLIAHLGPVAVACGAIRRLDEGTAEVKRMYVLPPNRGQGIGAAILAALETAALQLGCSRLVLETGSRQTAAMGLYQAVGFVPIPRFGEYIGLPLSVCLEKRLVV
jgi:putative acetyltransferase